MKALIGLAFVLAGIVQICATFVGIEHYTGFGWFLSGFFTLLTGWVPLVGTILGVYGAHVVWGWGLFSSILLFTFPYIIYVIAIILGAFKLASLRRNRF